MNEIWEGKGQGARYGVYKFVYNQEIIYIGLADSGIETRIKQHGKPGDNIPEEGWSEINASDIYYIVLPNNEITNFVEKHLIKKYQPKYNKQGTGTEALWDNFPLEEPKWHKYNKANIYMSNPNIPKYLQLPLSSSKLNTLQRRIITNYRHWFLLTAINDNNMQPGKTYFMDNNDKIFPSFCLDFLITSDNIYQAGFNHQHWYLQNVKKNNSEISMTLLDNKNGWLSDVKAGIMYYTEELQREIRFLEKEYGERGYILRQRKYKDQSIKNIIVYFKIYQMENI